MPPNNDFQHAVSTDYTKVTGRVMTFGDIHGAAVFKDVLKQIKPDDRIVLVGDMMDRGVETFEIMQQIIAKQQQIVAVRGNHEDMFLKFMAVRKKIETTKNSTVEFPQSLASDIEFAQRKGNIDSFIEQFAKNNGLTIQEANDFLLFIFNGGGWALQQTCSALQPIVEYVGQLPFVREIKLPNDSSYLVCHSDMRFISDEMLAPYFLDPAMKFTDQEQIHLTYARTANEEELCCDSKQEAKRTKNSKRVYSGHEITTRKGVKVFREETNTIDLDFGAYDSNGLIGVEHPNKVLMFGVVPRAKTAFHQQLHKLSQLFQCIEFGSAAGLKEYAAYLESNHIKGGVIQLAPDVKMTQSELAEFASENELTEFNKKYGNENIEQLLIRYRIQNSFKSVSTIHKLGQLIPDKGEFRNRYFEINQFNNTNPFDELFWNPKDPTFRMKVAKYIVDGSGDWKEFLQSFIPSAPTAKAEEHPLAAGTEKLIPEVQPSLLDEFSQLKSALNSAKQEPNEVPPLNVFVTDMFTCDSPLFQKNRRGIPIEIITCKNGQTLVKVGPCDLSGVGGHENRKELIKKIVNHALKVHAPRLSYDNVHVSASVAVRSFSQVIANSFSFFESTQQKDRKAKGSRMNAYIKTAGEAQLTHWDPQDGPEGFWSNLSDKVIAAVTQLFEYKVKNIGENGRYPSEQATTDILKSPIIKSVFKKLPRDSKECTDTLVTMVNQMKKQLSSESSLPVTSNTNIAQDNTATMMTKQTDLSLKPGFFNHHQFKRLVSSNKPTAKGSTTPGSNK
jgi:hypothetical protein